MDLETAQAHLDAWLDAELKLAEAQRYKFRTPSGEQEVQRADLPEVAKRIEYWTNQVRLLSGRTQSRFSLVSFNHPDYQ